MDGLFHAPLALLCKTVTLLSEEALKEAASLAWHLLLEHENEVTNGRRVWGRGDQ